MSSLGITNMIAVVPVEDHSRATTWYAKLLGREADLVPIEDVAEWRLAGSAWLQVGKDPERAGSTTVVIGVDDILALQSIIAKANVQFGEIIEYPGVIKMGEVLDPDGNKVVFVQDISGES
jgi:hypothetical protein